MSVKIPSTLSSPEGLQKPLPDKTDLYLEITGACKTRVPDRGRPLILALRRRSVHFEFCNFMFGFNHINFLINTRISTAKRVNLAQGLTTLSQVCR